MEEIEEELIPVSIDADELINEVRELPEMDAVDIQISASVELSPILGDIIGHSVFTSYNSEYRELEAFVDSLDTPTISSQITADGYQDMHIGMITSTTPRAVVEAVSAIANRELAETGNVPTIATNNNALQEAIDAIAAVPIRPTPIHFYHDSGGVAAFIEDEGGTNEEAHESTWEEQFIAPPVPMPPSNAIIPEILIPVNSETLNISDVTSRFSGAIWANQITLEKVILAGLGGIGSYVAFLLSRVNVGWLTLYDNDSVEAANLSGQLFGNSDVSKYKTTAITNFIRNYSTFAKVTTSPQRYITGSRTGPIMICGFDSMTSRSVYFNSWLRYIDNLNMEERSKCLFIDGRLAAEEYQVFCIKGDDTYSLQKYNTEYLFNDSQAEPTICSFKQTSFMATQIASTMVNLFVNFVANKCNPFMERSLPFYTSYDAETMNLKTED